VSSAAARVDAPAPANGNGHANGNGNGDGHADGLGAWLEWKRPVQAAGGVVLDAFKETLSGVPAPVTIVTTLGDGGPHGTTVSAFSSLSADPPLVLVALDRGSDLLGLLRETGRFAVNLLSAGQEDLGLACARKGRDKFECIAWREEQGLPRIEGAAAWLVCEIEELLPGGDHVIVVGLVTACETSEVDPLVYHRRRFFHVA
jgi:flavin reductase (DIM6/NTAB) family NADH-FMN oxidoreductase RutF